LNELIRLACAGARIHLSDRIRPCEGETLERLAAECEAGGTRLVYYHHAEFGPNLTGLSRRRAWVHLKERSLPDGEARRLFWDILKSSGTRARFILYSRGRLDPRILGDFLNAGAFLLFQQEQFDYRSPFRALERFAARRRLPITAYYLYPDFLL
jgi:hypothetical protein